MFDRHLISRTFQIGAFGAFTFLCAAPAKSEPKAAAPAAGKKKGGGAPKACTTARATAKEREQAAKLREAKELLQSCAKQACGQGIQKECQAGITRLEAGIPSVVPMVTDSSGAPRVDVQVRMDGELLTSRLDGRAIPVDPGWHEFSFSTDSGVFAKQNIMIVEGQRSRLITIGGSANRAAAMPAPAPVPVAAAPAPAPAPEAPPPKAAPEPTPAPSPAETRAESSAEVSVVDHPRGKPSAVPYIIGGVGVLGLGAGGLLTLWGKKDNDKLSGCSPDCAQASVDHVKHLYTAADIAFVAGVGLIGVSAYLFATSGSRSEKSPQTAYVVDVKPTRSGAFATVGGAF